MKFTRLIFIFMALVLSASPSHGSESKDGNWYPYEVDVLNPPFDMESEKTSLQYVPLKKAKKKWQLCVSFPHMKDAYWTAVNYGIINEAERLGVKINLVEAGGYTNLSKQISQIEDCISSGANALIVGAISYQGLNNVISEARNKNIPVIDVINGVSSTDIVAKSLVSFGEMGGKTGEYLVAMHPNGTKKMKVAWFPGPSGAGWVEAGHKGFSAAVANGAIELLETKYGDTGKEVQTKLVEDTLQAHPDVDYIVGTAVTAEAAASILRSRGLANKIKVISYYFTPGVENGIKSGRIMAAPTDSTVIQGRIAVDQAVRVLEGIPYRMHVGPQLFMVDESNIDTFNRDGALAPMNFKPTFNLD